VEETATIIALNASMQICAVTALLAVDGLQTQWDMAAGAHLLLLLEQILATLQMLCHARPKPCASQTAIIGQMRTLQMHSAA
jgi:hypothetical protein